MKVSLESVCVVVCIMYAAYHAGDLLQKYVMRFLERGKPKRQYFTLEVFHDDLDAGLRAVAIICFYCRDADEAVGELHEKVKLLGMPEPYKINRITVGPDTPEAKILSLIRLAGGMKD